MAHAHDLSARPLVARKMCRQWKHLTVEARDRQRQPFDEEAAQREFVRLNAATFGVMRPLPKRQ